MVSPTMKGTLGKHCSFFNLKETKTGELAKKRDRSSFKSLSNKNESKRVDQTREHSRARRT